MNKILLETREVLELLNKTSKQTGVVLTGRYAPKELLGRADFVNDMKDIEYPKEMVTTKGIQY